LAARDESVLDPSGSMTWTFADLPAARVAHLTEPFAFSTLLEELQPAAISCKREFGNLKETSGRWRPSFSLHVSASTFDRFYNSPFGYRGQFWQSAELGIRQNRFLLDGLLAALVRAVNESNDRELMARRASIVTSLQQPAAKIWILNEPQALNFVVEIEAERWVAAATSDWERYQSGALSPNDVIDRIAGVRAPEGTVLEVKGAWIDRDGEPVGASPGKDPWERARQIYAYGFNWTTPG
jgi:hypothetical protein